MPTIPLLREGQAAIRGDTRELQLYGERQACARPGETVVLYISSHGSLRVNDAGSGQLYQLEDEQHKLDSTIVPADAY